MTTWLKCTTPRPEAAWRLVCFPHAGGSAPFFHNWAKGLPAYEVHAVCYPGRTFRIDEPLPTSLLTLAADIAEAVGLLRGEGPVAFLGHSMGAVVAFETARLLQARGHGISHLFASGARAPHLAHPEGTGTAGMDDEAIAAALMALGGTDAELLADPDFRELILPFVCGDFRMFDAYVHRTGALRCDVTTIAGDADPQVGPGHAAAWAEVTEGRSTHHMVPGDHFYLASRPPFALIEAALSGEVSQATRRP